MLTLPAELDPYPAQPRLTFRPDGTLKLTVFSDLHYGENAWDAWGPQQDVNSTRLMRRVLSDEQPDFVYVAVFLFGSESKLTEVWDDGVVRMLNGDLITGENTFKENSTVYIDMIVDNLNDAKIPFCSTYGVRLFIYSLALRDTERCWTESRQ